MADYTFYLGTAKAASDFELTKDYLINHIRKTYDTRDDIAKALETEAEFDLSTVQPMLKVSRESDAMKKAAENKEFEMEQAADMELFAKQKRCYSNNKIKAYALLWEQSTRGMHSRVLSNKDYESKIKGDPIKLIKCIKKLSLNAQDSRYQPSITFNSMKAFLACRQQEGESLQDYTRRFKTTRDIMVTQVGDKIKLKQIMKSLEGWDDNDPSQDNEYKKNAWDRYITFVYLGNADKTKYGTVIKNLAAQFSLGNNQYPSPSLHHHMCPVTIPMTMHPPNKGQKTETTMQMTLETRKMKKLSNPQH